MPNPHLTATGTPWWGSSTPTVSRPPSMPPMLSWTGGQGQGSGSTTTNVVNTGNDGRGDGTGVNTTNTEQATVQEIMNSNMTEAQKWEWLYDLQNQWQTEQYPLGTGNLGISSPFVLTATDLGNPKGLAWQSALPNEPGAQLVNGEWKKPILSGIGRNLFEREEGLPSLGGEGASQELKDIANQYYAIREEEERAQPTDVDPNYGYDGGDPGGGGGYAGGDGYAYGVKGFHRGRPENISPWAKNIAGTPMLPVAGSGAGASMAAADELYALASGKKAFSMTPEEQGILALLNA
jgi:hypothetical protein